MGQTAAKDDPRRADVALHPWRWTRRLAAGYVLLAVLLPVSYWAWGVAADARLHAAEAAMRAAGQPVTAEELNALQKPVTENAMPDIVAASGAMSVTTTQAEWMSPSGTWSASDWQMAAEIVAANERALARLHDAAQKNEIDWGIDYRTYDWLTFFSRGPGLSLGSTRSMANVLLTAARYHHHLGDDQAAAQDLAALGTLARADRHPPALIGSLAAMAIEGMALRGWREILPDLQVTDSARTPRGLRRTQIEAAARRMVAAPYEPVDAHVPAGEWALEQAIFTAPPAAATGWSSVAPYSSMAITIPPLRKTMHARTAELELAQAAARAEPTYPRALARASTWVLRKPHQLVIAGMLAFGESLDGSSLLKLYYRWKAERQMTGLALAIRLYRLDHQMAWPQRLEDLVPTYAPALPADVFRADGKTYGYVTTGLPRVYSVGPDMTDDGGVIDTPGPAGALPAGSEQKDLMVFLVGPQATTQPARERPGSETRP